MTSYLRFEPDLGSADLVSAFDELPLWSAMSGLVLLEHLRLRSGLRVLDVGCGTGFPSIELAERIGPRGRVVGIDPWTAAVERARSKARTRGVTNLEIHVGDAATMPFDDGSFDLVVSNLGLNNFDDPAAALVACRRVIAPTGRLALATNLRGHMREFYDSFETTLRALDRPAEVDALRGHVEHRATVASVTALLDRAGFAVTRTAEQTSSMRFADGTALLNHWFIKLGFLPAWKGIVSEADRPTVFARLEADLNAAAAARGDLELTIPLAFVEAEPTSADPDKQQFLDLTKRLEQSNDPTEQAQLEEEPARLTFGE